MKNRELAQIALLIALQIILTLTPLGFIALGVMTITLMHIPVIIGAIVIGPRAAAILGTVFGISSIISATRIGTPDVIVFSPFLSGSPLSIVVSIVPRIAFALVTAYVFKLLYNTTMNIRLISGITAAVGSICNTVFTLSAVYILFGRVYANLVGVAYDTLLGVFIAVGLTNGIIEVLVAVVICSLLARPLMYFNRD